MAARVRDESEYDSSSSSITVPNSRQSWVSDFSFGSRSSISVSCYNEAAPKTSLYKPHKANEAAWEAIKRLRGETGSIGLDNFRLVRRVGSGDLGNVYLCQLRNTDSLYAMKVVDREALAFRNKVQRADMEKEILGMLDHPFLPTLYAEFEASHYSCLVMEFCPGGDLHALRQRLPGKRFSFSSAKFYAAEILLALEYLHMMGIVYRDLKPENVLVREDGHIMLSDFDLSLKCQVVPKLILVECPSPTKKSSGVSPIQPVLSCFSSSSNQLRNKTVQQVDPELVAEPVNARSKSFVGTHEYLAPEVISGLGHGSAVDWWTFGVFLYELLYGMTPFKGENNEKTLINIIKHPLTFPSGGEEVRVEEDLIRKLLVKNPKRRIGSSKGSVEIKRHDFFKGVNWALIRSLRPPQDVQDKGAAYQIPQHFDYF